MLVLALTELVRLVHRLDLDLPQIKQKIATITAITNIMPKIQKANASFDDDIHKMPSECKLRAFAAISSTEKNNNSSISMHSIFVINRSISTYHFHYIDDHFAGDLIQFVAPVRTTN